MITFDRETRIIPSNKATIIYYNITDIVLQNPLFYNGDIRHTSTERPNATVIRVPLGNFIFGYFLQHCRVSLLHTVSFTLISQIKRLFYPYGEERVNIVSLSQVTWYSRRDLELIFGTFDSRSPVLYTTYLCLFRKRPLSLRILGGILPQITETLT